MEKQISDNIYLYQFNDNNYIAGQSYGNLILKRNFDINIINVIYEKHWDYLKTNNSPIIIKLLKKKILNWLDLIKEKDYLIQFEKGLAKSLNVSVDKIIELQILGELSGIFCTIYTDNKKNIFYRILDTNISNRELLQQIYPELHILNINGNITFGNPIYLVNHTFISENFSFATFGNNLLDKKTYLQNTLPFYYKLKIYLDSANDEYDLIEKFNKDNEIYYDVEIIIKGKYESFHIDVMDESKNKKGLIIERSDYSPLEDKCSLDNLDNLHTLLPDFNRIFILFVKDGEIYFNNSLTSDDFIRIN